MASKGQKFKKYTNEEKEEIINKLIAGISSYFLAEEYGL